MKNGEIYKRWMDYFHKLLSKDHMGENKAESNGSIHVRKYKYCRNIRVRSKTF